MKTVENKNEILESFKQGPANLENVLAGLSPNQLDYLPLKGGWNIRQIVHHITDGDDLWKTCIKMALGNENAEFTLQWYAALPQTEWGKRWGYDKRPIDTSLALFKVNREHIVQLLECVSNWSTYKVQFRNLNGEEESITVGFIIQMQAQHVSHHIKRILEIRKEILGV